MTSIKGQYIIPVIDERGSVSPLLWTFCSLTEVIKYKPDDFISVNMIGSFRSS